MKYIFFQSLQKPALITLSHRSNDPLNPLPEAADPGVDPWEGRVAPLCAKADHPCQVPATAEDGHQGSPRVPRAGICSRLASGTELAVEQGEGGDPGTQLALGGSSVVLLLAGRRVHRLKPGELEQRGGGGALGSSPTSNYQLSGRVGD